MITGNNHIRKFQLADNYQKKKTEGGMRNYFYGVAIKTNNNNDSIDDCSSRKTREVQSHKVVH